MKNTISPHNFLRSFWIACLSYLSRLQYVWFLVHVYIGAIINSSDKLAELIVYIIPLEQRCFVCAFKQRKPIESVLLTGKHIDHSGERLGINLLLCTFITGPFVFNCDLNDHGFEEGRLRLLWA